MAEFLVVCLINHVMDCMVWCIKKNPAGMALYRDNRFAKYGSYCGLLSWIRNITTTKNFHAP